MIIYKEFTAVQSVAENVGWGTRDDAAAEKFLQTACSA